MACIKPPLGLVPKYIRDEERLQEVADAIYRYLNHPMKIPIKWVAEYNELVEKCQKK